MSNKYYWVNYRFTHLNHHCWSRHSPLFFLSFGSEVDFSSLLSIKSAPATSQASEHTLSIYLNVYLLSSDPNCIPFHQSLLHTHSESLNFHQCSHWSLAFSLTYLIFGLIAPCSSCRLSYVWKVDWNVPRRWSYVSIGLFLFLVSDEICLFIWNDFCPQDWG